jgi:FLVCR family feline leukemia virus subgroup C receptor-related protein
LFQNGEKFAGEVGLVFVVGGMVGSVIFGIILDKTHKFK